MRSRLDPELLQALGSPSFYRGELGLDCDVVEVVHTHSSVVFLAGDRAFKVKKPVAFDFLDYSTRARRRRACLEELAVNADLAPHIYIGVRAIVRRGGSFGLDDVGVPNAVDYAVEMARFGEADTLAGAIAAGRLGHAQVRAVAERIASFHRDATRVDGGSPEAVSAMWERNCDELAALRLPVEVEVRALRRFGHSFVSGRTAELERRVRDGHVRDGHGDLRCEHVLLTPEVQIVDRIEFDPRLRAGDVAADLAFLTMELELHRQGWAARELIAAYRHAGGSAGGEELRAFYGSYWALVRAKVALIGGRRRQGRRLFELVDRLSWRARRPLLLVVCGPPASGKSTLAAELARRTGLPLLSSDVIRKRLAGMKPTARAQQSHYSAQFTHSTYDLLSREALASLRLRDGAVLDASFGTRGQRALLDRRLRQAHGAALFVLCEAPLQVALSRAHNRIADERRISDAGPEIVAAKRRAFQPLSEIPGLRLAVVDSRIPLGRQVEQVAAAADLLLATHLSALPRLSGAFTR